MPWDSWLLMTQSFSLLSLWPFPGNDLAPLQFQSLCDVIVCFEVVFLKRSGLGETTLVLGNGQYGVIKAQHPSADPCVWRCFYRHQWGSPERYTSSWSNNSRKGHQTCAAHSPLPVTPLQVAGLLLLHSDTSLAVQIANGMRGCKKGWWERTDQRVYTAYLIFSSKHLRKH